MSETISSDYSSKVWEQYGVEKEEDRPKASSFASEESIFTESNYDRTKTERDVIINYQTKPDDKDSKATYLDIDKYYDEYHVSNKDTYFDDVALQYMTDIAAYFGVDLNDEDSLEKMADIYEQIAEKNNMTTKRSNYTNVEDYIVACNTEIAKRSWNGTLDDDFIDLTGVSTDKKAEDDADGDDSTTVLPDGWTQNDDGTFTTADGKTVEAIDYEDLETNEYTVSDDGKILDKDGNEVGITVTSQMDTDGDGVEDDVTSYFVYSENASETHDSEYAVSSADLPDGYEIQDNKILDKDGNEIGRIENGIEDVTGDGKTDFIIKYYLYGEKPNADLPEGWTVDENGTITTDDGKTVEAIDYEDLEKNGYSVNDDGKIIDKDGKEVGRTVTFQKDTDDDGVEDDVTSYYAYVDEAESTDDASDDDTTTDTSSSKAITELIDSGISGDSDIIKMLEADDNLTVETTADGYKIGDTVFDKSGKKVE